MYHLLANGCSYREEFVLRVGNVLLVVLVLLIVLFYFSIVQSHFSAHSPPVTASPYPTMKENTIIHLIPQGVPYFKLFHIT